MTDHSFPDDPTLDRLEQLLRATGPAPEPSAELRARLLAIPAAEPRGASGPRRRFAGIWSNLQAWRLASGVLAVAAIALAVIASTGGSSNSVPGQQVALASAPEYQATGQAVSLVTGGTRRIHIRIENLPRLAPNQVFELWIARDRAHRVGLGIYRPGTSGVIDTTVSVPDLGSAWHGVWLTVEKDDGAPGWSRDWVLAGKLA
jgi:anti-sigma-K factor RskA